MISLSASEKRICDNFLQVARNSAVAVIAHNRKINARHLTLPTVRYMVESIRLDLQTELSKMSGGAVEKLQQRN